jgi:hypothetical protein
MGLNIEWTELRMGLNIELTTTTSNETISTAVKNNFLICLVSNFFNMELKSCVEVLITFFD